MPVRTRAEDPSSHAAFGIVTAAFVVGMLMLATAMAIVPVDSSVWTAGFGIFVALVVLFMPLSVLGAVYLWRIYLEDSRTRSSWLLLRDALLGTAWTSITLYVGATSVLRLSGFGPFSWTPPFTAVAVVLASSTTAYMAAVYWLRRRTRHTSHPTPDEGEPR